MQEGPIKENSYYYPAMQIQEYLERLPLSENVEDQYLDNLDEKIVIMTHDDEFDQEMLDIEKRLDFESTWFLLDTEINKKIPKDIDIHIHFNKETGLLSDQIGTFRSRFGFEPKFNRNHRLLWRANNFDFPLMAINGILADSTLIGTRPFRPVINGKVIPIIEFPFCITDKSDRFMASYSVARDSEQPFRHGLSPIVILSHPFSICQKHKLKSCFHDCIKWTFNYGYKMLSLNSFYNRYIERCQIKNMVSNVFTTKWNFSAIAE